MSRRKKKSEDSLPPGERVLALDIASAVGYAYGVNGKVIKYGKYISDNTENIGLRLLRFSKWLSRMIASLPARPDVVIIEQPYLGRNAHTHAILNRYIGVAQREIYRILGVNCEFLTPREVKTKLKVPKGKNHKQHKINMVRKINSILGTDFRYVAGRSAKSKRSDDDICDAIALLLVYWIKKGAWKDGNE